MGAILRNVKGVPALGLTWRDAVSTAALILVLLAYYAYLMGATFWLISSAWATTAVILVLGGGCAIVAAGDLYTKPHPRPVRIYRGIVTGIGMIALVAGLAGLLGDSAYALRILVITTILLWMLGTVWHTYTIGSEP